jgi:long-subunit acyl-CoA synthetase (AMP-forming)
MSILFETLRQQAVNNPETIALRGAQAELSYAGLQLAVSHTSADLLRLDISVLGLLADNNIAWALADLAAMDVQIPLVPIPLFFSPRQILHVLHDTGMDGLLTDQPAVVIPLLYEAGIKLQNLGQLAGLSLIRLLDVPAKTLPPGTAKITYTSGTTAEPKGVCLSLAQMETVAFSLRDASLAKPTDRHLCLTPLSTLLENIGGIYTPLLSGASSHLLPLRQVGLNGASGLDIKLMLQALHVSKASSAIMAPQMLLAIVTAGESGIAMPADLRFVAVGGAPVSPQLLDKARRLGLPVYEGYGLSECCSVLALNTPHAIRPGSVGRPLPHTSITIAEDGEIVVQGSTFLGYLGQEQSEWPLKTGDLGYLDSEGYLHITGRKKSMFITSFGRNVAPEWVERELMLHPAIAQVVVFGEARPCNIAVIVARGTPAEVDLAITATNRLLPDYAQIREWIAAQVPFTTNNLQLTANGRLRRDEIWKAYQPLIDAMNEEQFDAVL